MNPKCCSTPLKRGWSCCPECAEPIDWETKAQKLARKKEHLRKMETDPEYRKRYEAQQIFLRPQWDHYEKQFLEDKDPIMKLGINRINSHTPGNDVAKEG